MASAAWGSRRYGHIRVCGKIPIPSEVTDRRAGQVGITKTGYGVIRKSEARLDGLRRRRVKDEVLIRRGRGGA